MKTSMTFLTASLAIVVWFGSHSCVTTSAQDPPRSKCCGAQKAAAQTVQSKAKSASPAIQTHVCPRYQWMDWGSYQSYYAESTPLCIPTNFDTTDPNPNLGGNCANGTGCSPTFRGSKARPFDPGIPGYGKPGEPRKREHNGIPGGAVGVTVDEADQYVIMFKTPPNRTVYAQIFIAKVTPLKGDEPPGILVRGIEIDPTAIVRHDYTKWNPGQGPVKPLPGRGRAYLYSHGSFDVEIIMHRDTPAHRRGRRKAK